MCRAASAAAVGLLCVGMLAGCGAESTSGSTSDDSVEGTGLRGAAIAPEPEVGDLSLPVAATSEPLPFRADPGELLLVYFGYTSCPDVCPLTMSDLAFVLDEDLPAADAERVQVAMATIDPERDTADVIDRYVTSFIPDGIALRTDDDTALRAAADGFGVAYEVTPVAGAVPEVTHSGSIYAVDDEGHVVVQWLFGTPAEDITHDLELLLDEMPATAAGTTPEETDT